MLIFPPLLLTACGPTGAPGVESPTGEGPSPRPAPREPIALAPRDPIAVGPGLPLGPRVVEAADADVKIVGQRERQFVRHRGVFDDGRLFVEQWIEPTMFVADIAGTAGTVSLVTVTTSGIQPLDDCSGPSRIAGDVSGDGREDVLVALRSGESRCEPVLLFGPLGASVDPGDGLRLRVDGLDSGTCAEPVGDVTGDGSDDLLVGGRYVLAGPVTGHTDVRDAAYSVLAQEIRPQALQPRRADLNGDGLTDLLGINLPEDSYGKAFLAIDYEVAPGASGDIPEASLGHEDGIDAFEAWDFDGDGYDDLFVRSGPSYGNWYVVTGPVTSAHAVDAAASSDTVFLPDAGNGFLPGVGDLDGDAVGDVVLASFEIDTHSTGVLSVFLAPGPGAYDAEDADVTIAGTHPTSAPAGTPDSLGELLHVADLDQDGVSDMVASAEGDDEGGLDAGAIYIFYGASLF